MHGKGHINTAWLASNLMIEVSLIIIIKLMIVIIIASCFFYLYNVILLEDLLLYGETMANSLGRRAMSFLRHLREMSL